MAEKKTEQTEEEKAPGAKTLEEQTKEDREYLLANLPAGIRRVQVIDPTGKQVYKRPDDVDVDLDKLPLTGGGLPIVMRRPPGRPGKVPLNPATPVIAEVDRARERHLANDRLLREVSTDSESDASFGLILAGMAKEASQIEWERMELQRHGQQYSTVAARRARILKSMAELTLRKKSNEADQSINLEGPQFKAVFGLMLETFKNAMREAGARNEIVETTFTSLVRELSGDWNEEARRRMKDVSK